jgi:hypothetical protein
MNVLEHSPFEIITNISIYFRNQHFNLFLKILPKISHCTRKLYYKLIILKEFWSPILERFHCDLSLSKNKLNYLHVYQSLYKKRNNILNLFNCKALFPITEILSNEFLIKNEKAIKEKIPHLIRNKFFDSCISLLCRYLDLNILIYDVENLNDISSSNINLDLLFDHSNFVINANELESNHSSLVYDLIKKSKIVPELEFFVKFPKAFMIELLIKHGLDPNYKNGILVTLIEDKTDYYVLRDCGKFNLRARNDYLLYQMRDRDYIVKELIEKYQLNPLNHINSLINCYVPYIFDNFNRYMLIYILNYPGIIKALDMDKIKRIKDVISLYDYDNRKNYPEPFCLVEPYSKEIKHNYSYVSFKKISILICITGIFVIFYSK